MKKVLLLNEKYIKDQSVIELNADAELLKQTIVNVQEVSLRPVLGNTLYEQIMDEVYDALTNSTELATGTKTLVDDYVKPFLLYAVIVDYILIGNYKVTNKGVLKLNDDKATNASTAELNHVKNYYEGYMNSYKSRLIEFLKNTDMLPFGADTNIDSSKGGWFIPGADVLGMPDGGKKLEIIETDPLWNADKPNYYTKATVDGFVTDLETTGGSGITKNGTSFNLGGTLTENATLNIGETQTFGVEYNDNLNWNTVSRFNFNKGRFNTYLSENLSYSEFIASSSGLRFQSFDENNLQDSSLLVNPGYVGIKSIGGNPSLEFSIENNDSKYGYYFSSMAQSATNKDFVVMQDLTGKIWQVPSSNFATPTSAVMLAGNQTITGVKTISPTLTATVNNQKLFGLEINPTFNAGTFTGVESNFLKLGNFGYIGTGPGGNPRISSSNSALVIIDGAVGVNIGKNTNSNTAWVNIFSNGDTKPIAAFLNSGAARVMTLLDSGNLLLGTTVDGGDKLQVNGIVNATSFKLGAYGSTINESSSRMYVQARNNKFDILTVDGSTFVASLSKIDAMHTFWGSTNNNWMRFEPNFNRIQAGGTNASYLELYNPVSGNTSLVSTSTTAAYGNICFLTQSVEAMRISTAGNLLVGKTTDSGYRLAVEGAGDSLLSASATFLNTNATGTSVGTLVTVGTASSSGFIGAYSQSYNNSTYAKRMVVGANSNANGLTISAGAALNQDIRFVLQSGEAARLIQGGNFLIGSTTDNGGRLQVTGSASISGVINATGQYIYGDTTNPFIRLSNGAGTQFGYGTNYFSIGGAGFKFTASSKDFLQYRTTYGMRLDDTNSTSDPQFDNLRAVLALTSTTKGFLPPRLTTAQRDAIVTPPAGLLIYNNETNTMNYFNGTSWVSM